MRRFSGLMVLVPLLGAMVPAPAVVAGAGPASIDSALATVRAARKVMMNDPAAALRIGVELDRLGSRLDDGRERRIVQAKAKWIAGEASLRLDRVDEARRLIDASHALAVASGDAQSQGDSLLSRGSIKSESGDPAGALQDYLAAYRLFQRTGDARSRSITLQDMSQLYAAARDYARAEAYLHQAAEIYAGEPLTRLALANSTANLRGALGHHADAEREYRRGLSIARDLKLHALELMLLSNLALAQISQQRLAAASHTVDRMFDLSRRTRTPIGDKARATTARLAFARGDTGAARRIMDGIVAPPGRKAPVLAEDIEYNAYEIYKATSDSGLALVHLENANRLRNAAVALAISNKSALMAARFDFATQNLRIAALKAASMQRDMAVQREAAARERRFFATAGLLVFVLIAMLSAWLVALRRSRNQIGAVNVRLEQANTVLETLVREVGQRTQAERDATALANHDALTGLPNRRQLSEDFLATLYSQNKPGSDVFLMLLDLDRFKAINDFHGHETGDLVLVTTADRLKSLCSRTGARAVRLGGDEFVVAMCGPDRAGAESLAGEVIAAIAEPIDFGERHLQLGVSVGIACYLRDGATVGDLLRAADMAMYEAKRSGSGSWRFFEPRMKIRRRLRAA